MDIADESVRHKQSPSVPEKIERAVTSIQHNIASEVKLRHTLELPRGFVQLTNKGTILFTFYNTAEKE